MRFWAVALLWLAVNLGFWGWWLQQTQRSTPWLYWAETVALFYQTTLGIDFEPCPSGIVMPAGDID